MPEYKNSAFAGEMLVAAELSRLGYEVLLGNVGTHRTVGVDLAAVRPDGRTVAISVKSLKESGSERGQSFIIDPERVRPEVVYVFVVTHGAGHLPEFFAVRGAALLVEEERVWGKWGRRYEPRSGRGIYPALLAPWKNWDAIEQGAVA